MHLYLNILNNSREYIICDILNPSLILRTGMPGMFKENTNILVTKANTFRILCGDLKHVF